ncbi:MAG: hypothetical protein GXY19_21870 [Phycisphaerae bacterium]|nr:hypothetical protein [Phycisphaerae bacterium]
MIDTVDCSRALNQIYQTTRTRTEAPAETGSPEAETEDALTLSGEAQAVLQLPSLFGVEPGRAITLADMQAFADEQLEAFGKGFRALMRGNDIDMSQPVRLGHEYGGGRLIVTNGHPDADKIEGLLAENPALCNQCTAATSTLALVKHGQEHAKFAQAYAESPQAAVAQYAYLFDTRWDVSVTFTEDDTEVAYSRVPRQ